MSKLSDEDKALFAEAMQGVKPLKSDNRVQHPKPPKRANTKKKPLVHTEPAEEMLHENLGLSDVSAEQTLFYAQSGVPPKTIRELKRAQLPIDLTLDLHGMYSRDAEQAVLEVLQQAKVRHLRVLHIIHGKAGRDGSPPVIKNKVNRWLHGHPQVLAFCSCPANMGGSGGIVVLLNRDKG